MPDLDNDGSRTLFGLERSHDDVNAYQKSRTLFLLSSLTMRLKVSIIKMLLNSPRLDWMVSSRYMPGPSTQNRQIQVIGVLPIFGAF